MKITLYCVTSATVHDAFFLSVFNTFADNFKINLCKGMYEILHYCPTGLSVETVKYKTSVELDYVNGYLSSHVQ